MSACLNRRISLTAEPIWLLLTIYVYLVGTGKILGEGTITLTRIIAPRKITLKYFKMPLGGATPYWLPFF